MQKITSQLTFVNFQSAAGDCHSPQDSMGCGFPSSVVGQPASSCKGQPLPGPSSGPSWSESAVLQAHLSVIQTQYLDLQDASCCSVSSASQTESKEKRLVIYRANFMSKKLKRKQNPCQTINQLYQFWKRKGKKTQKLFEPLVLKLLLYEG